MNNKQIAVNEAAFAWREEAYELLGEYNVLGLAPAGAGKTRIGYEALKRANGGVYVAPTRGLCLEKYGELKATFPGNGVVLGNKDYCLPTRGFKSSNVRVITHFKLNQMLQNLGRKFAKHCNRVVLDEIQGLDSELDITITKLKLLCPDVRTVSLCHTLHDDDVPKFANWLDAKVVRGTERPVPLIHRLIEFQSDLDDDGNEVSTVLVREGNKIVDSDAISGIPNNFGMVGYAVRQIRESGDDAPIQIFTPYTEIAKRMAEFLAEENESWDEELQAAADGLIDDASDHTETLKQLLPRGVAIHHGKLSQQERELVQKLVVAGKINILVSCYTLASGVNLPTKYLIFERVYDYDYDKDSGEKRLIRPQVYHNCAGRAGRPNMQEEGIVVTLATNEIEVVEIQEVLWKTKAARIESRIYDEYFLTTQLPQLILLGWNTTEKIINEVIRSTFWGQTLQDTQPLFDQFERIISSLIEKDVCGIIRSDRLYLTKKGIQIARLGVHPDEYEVMADLAQSGSLDYQSWISRLAKVVAEYVVRRGDVQDEDIQNLVQFGITAYTTKECSWNTRELADYVSRLLEQARNFFYLNELGDFAQEWDEKVYRKFTYGNLTLCHRLAPVLKRDQIKRLIRNLGKALEAESLDNTGLQSLAQLLWANDNREDEMIKEEISEVADILHENADNLSSFLGKEANNG